MNNVISIRNLIAVVATLTTGYIVSTAFSAIPSEITIEPSSDVMAVFDFMSEGGNYKILDPSEFPIDQQETARQIKENIIEALIRSGKFTRDQLEQPNSHRP